MISAFDSSNMTMSLAIFRIYFNSSSGMKTKVGTYLGFEGDYLGVIGLLIGEDPGDGQMVTGALLSGA